MTLKYVGFRDEYNSKQVIVFHEAVPHSTFKHLRCVSAGFVDVNVQSDGKITCDPYGDSKSLNLSCLPEDKLVLDELFRDNRY
jgi:hypothetical protein